MKEFLQFVGLLLVAGSIWFRPLPLTEVDVQCECSCPTLPEGVQLYIPPTPLPEVLKEEVVEEKEEKKEEVVGVIPPPAAHTPPPPPPAPTLLAPVKQVMSSCASGNCSSGRGFFGRRR